VNSGFDNRVFRFTIFIKKTARFLFWKRAVFLYENNGVSLPKKVGSGFRLYASLPAVGAYRLYPSRANATFYCIFYDFSLYNFFFTPVFCKIAI
jgi:hypothetical protein